MVTNNASNEKTAAAGKVLQGQGIGVTSDFSTATYPSTATGTGKILIADGTNWVASTPTYPNTSASSGKFLISDGTNFIASTPTIPNTAGTSGKVLVSDGTNYISSTPTFPNASATSRKIIVSDGTNWVASTETYAVPGTSGNVMTSDGTNWTSAAAGGGFSPNGTINISEDFMSVASLVTDVIIGELGWSTANDGTGISGFAHVDTSENGHPGIIGNVSAASSSDYMYLGDNKNFILGGGAITMNWVIKTATLSTGTNRYTLRIGFGDSHNADQVNGAYFEYSDNLNSGNWNVKTAKASTRTTGASSTAVGTSWVNLKITVNAAATSIGYFVNGVEVANSPITTNIPTAAVNPFIDVKREAGTVATSSVLVDLFYMTQTLTSSR